MNEINQNMSELYTCGSSKKCYSTPLLLACGEMICARDVDAMIAKDKEDIDVFECKFSNTIIINYQKRVLFSSTKNERFVKNFFASE